MAKEKTEKENQIIINAENAVLGRLASYAAKQALLGKEIIIVNCEKAIVLGREKNILQRYQKKRARGGSSQKGPFIPTEPEKMMKRTIRNMMPYQKRRGREKLREIKCYKGIPQEFKDKEIIKSGRGRKGMSLEKISKMLRGGK